MAWLSFIELDKTVVIELDKARGGSQEELPLFQGKEQWLHFAEAVVKR